VIQSRGVRTAENALAWFPVYLNQSTNEPFISHDGRWEPVQDLNGFEAFEQIKTKKLYNTSTGEMV